MPKNSKLFTINGKKLIFYIEDGDNSEEYREHYRMLDYLIENNGGIISNEYNDDTVNIMILNDLDFRNLTNRKIYNSKFVEESINKKYLQNIEDYRIPESSRLLSIVENCQINEEISSSHGEEIITANKQDDEKSVIPHKDCKDKLVETEFSMKIVSIRDKEPKLEKQISTSSIKTEYFSCGSSPIESPNKSTNNKTTIEEKNQLSTEKILVRNPFFRPRKNQTENKKLSKKEKSQTNTTSTTIVKKEYNNDLLLQNNKIKTENIFINGEINDAVQNNLSELPVASSSLAKSSVNENFTSIILKIDPDTGKGDEIIIKSEETQVDLENSNPPNSPGLLENKTTSSVNFSQKSIGIFNSNKEQLETNVESNESDNNNQFQQESRDDPDEEMTFANAVKKRKKKMAQKKDNGGLISDVPNDKTINLVLDSNKTRRNINLIEYDSQFVIDSIKNHKMQDINKYRVEYNEIQQKQYEEAEKSLNLLSPLNYFPKKKKLNNVIIESINNDWDNLSLNDSNSSELFSDEIVNESDCSNNNDNINFIEETDEFVYTSNEINNESIENEQNLNYSPDSIDTPLSPVLFESFENVESSCENASNKVSLKENNLSILESSKKDSSICSNSQDENDKSNLSPIKHNVLIPERSKKNSSIYSNNQDVKPTSKDLDDYQKIIQDKLLSEEVTDNNLSSETSRHYFKEEIGSPVSSDASTIIIVREDDEKVVDTLMIKDEPLTSTPKKSTKFNNKESSISNFYFKKEPVEEIENKTSSDSEGEWIDTKNPLKHKKIVVEQDKIVQKNISNKVSPQNGLKKINKKNEKEKPTLAFFLTNLPEPDPVIRQNSDKQQSFHIKEKSPLKNDKNKSSKKSQLESLENLPGPSLSQSSQSSIRTRKIGGRETRIINNPSSSSSSSDEEENGLKLKKKYSCNYKRLIISDSDEEVENILPAAKKYKTNTASSVKLISDDNNTKSSIKIRQVNFINQAGPSNTQNKSSESESDSDSSIKNRNPRSSKISSDDDVYEPTEKQKRNHKNLIKQRRKDLSEEVRKKKKYIKGIEKSPTYEKPRGSMILSPDKDPHRIKVELPPGKNLKSCPKAWMNGKTLCFQTDLSREDRIIPTGNRPGYLTWENNAMIRYIWDHNEFHRVNSIHVFNEMYNSGILRHRSTLSLMSHWRRNIANAEYIKASGLPECVKVKFQEDINYCKSLDKL